MTTRSETGMLRREEELARRRFEALLMGRHQSVERGDEEGLRRLLRAKELIEDAYDTPLDLEAMARASHLSPYHFHRQFKAMFGSTPHQMLTARRMERARWLLMHTSASVTEVCFEVGFQSVGSFSAAFRRHMGAPPSHFQRPIYKVGWEDPLRRIPYCMLMFWGGIGKRPS